MDLSQSLARKWTDRESGKRPTMQQCMTMDALARQHGAGTPIFDVYVKTLEVEKRGHGKSHDECVRDVLARVVDTLGTHAKGMEDGVYTVAERIETTKAAYEARDAIDAFIEVVEPPAMGADVTPLRSAR
jgi:hypothetical protein